MSSQPRSVLDIPVGSKDPRRGFLGAFLVTIFLNSFWTGVLHVQAYLLFRRFPRDPIYLKALVSILCLFQTFYFGTSLSFLYYNVIYTAKNNAPILAGRWDIYYIATHRLITTTLTQIFFVARLWAYGLHKSATVPLGVMIAGTLAVGIVENYEVWHLQLGSGLFFWSLSAWNSLIVAVDTIISISLFVLMSKRKSGFKSTNSVMRMITLYGVATGGINSVLALASLIFNQLNYFPGQFVTIAPSSAELFTCPYPSRPEHSNTEFLIEDSEWQATSSCSASYIPVSLHQFRNDAAQYIHSFD
ncbi:hypothetical protein DL93DRAFT_415458 [Clavulina sp. PMI_390]|nr:hypothetical protein DL93DRAFT_415458 [Clavulina sp. PMI_390]